MTAEQYARDQREFLIETEKQSVIQIAAEFEEMKREFAAYLTRNYAVGEKTNTLANLYATNFLARTLLFLDNQLQRISIPFAAVVARAQKRMINFTGNSLKSLLPQVNSSIFAPDAEALKILIGRTQNGSQLADFFPARMRQPTGEMARKTLIEGFSLGESSEAIAGRINEITHIGFSRALTIARTETGEAYRAAAREFYQAADIKKYVWLSVLDPRTCLTCWHLHGRVFKSSAKIFAHPNCRCVLVPLTKNQTPIATGAEKFLKLEAGFQKQILGTKRFEMFQDGKSFDEFVSSRADAEYGTRYFIKNLSDL